MAGDYTIYKRRYSDITTDVLITALTPTPFTILTTRDINYRIFLQKISLVVSSYKVCVLSLVGHTSGLVYAQFSIPAAATSNSTDVFEIDYGPSGLGAVQIGENIDLVNSSVGVIAILHIEAYQKLAQTSTAAWDASPSTQKAAEIRPLPATNLLN